MSASEVLFAHVTRRRDEEIDLAAAALLIGEVEHGEIDLGPWINELDQLAEGSRQRAVDKWNRAIERSGATEQRLTLPHRRFHRHIGLYAGMAVDPEGNPTDQSPETWLPSREDRAYVASLMQPVYEPGKMAQWLAPPSKGVNSQPLDFEYVRLR